MKRRFSTSGFRKPYGKKKSEQTENEAKQGKPFPGNKAGAEFVLREKRGRNRTIACRSGRKRL